VIGFEQTEAVLAADRLGNLQGVSLGTIFDFYGQAGFRRLERRCLEQVIENHPRFVLATGGSIVSEPGTFERLLSACWTIWLKAAPAEHMGRVVAQGDMRPMSGNRESMADLQRILAGRADLCALARPHLSDPHFTLQAAARHGYTAQVWPKQYLAGKAQLERLDELQAVRARLAAFYLSALAPLHRAGRLRLPCVPPEARPNWHLFYFLVGAAEERERCLQHLRSHGIGAAFHFAPLHSSPFGRCLAIEARLADAAAVGTVYAGERTASATRRVAAWRHLRPLRLKGKRRPVETYELLGMLDAPGTRSGLGDEAPFVGRETELARLRAAGVGMLLACQDTIQLDRLYTPAGRQVLQEGGQLRGQRLHEQPDQHGEHAQEGGVQQQNGKGAADAVSTKPVDQRAQAFGDDERNKQQNQRVEGVRHQEPEEQQSREPGHAESDGERGDRDGEVTILRHVGHECVLQEA